MKYLVTAEAQDIWVKIGGALSANKNATSYPDDISKRSAELLANAKTFVFDASDLMPTAMNAAFWTAHGRADTQDPSRRSTRSSPTSTSVAGDAYSRAELTDLIEAERAPAAPPSPPLIARRSTMDPRLSTADRGRGRCAGRPDRLHLGHRAAAPPRARSGSRPRSGRGCGSLPALAFLGFFLVYPTIGTIIRSFQDKAGERRSSGSTTTPGSSPTPTPSSRSRNNVLWLVFLTAVHGRHRAAHRGPRRPGALRDRSPRASSSCRWRSAWSRPA